MKYKIIRSIIFITLILLYKNSFCSDSTINQLSNRIDVLEGFQENVKGNIENKFESLESKVNSENRLSYIILLTIGSVTIISLIVVYFQAHKYITKKLNEKFDNIITNKEGSLLRLIDAHSKDNQLINTKKLLVISSKDADDIFIRQFLRKMGFPINNVKFDKKDNSEIKDINQYDLIFINNEMDNLEMEIIMEIFKKTHEKTVFFYFGNQFARGTPFANRMNLANSRTQIAGNLMNLLKYHEIIG